MLFSGCGAALFFASAIAGGNHFKQLGVGDQGAAPIAVKGNIAAVRRKVFFAQKDLVDLLLLAVRIHHFVLCNRP